MIESVSSVVSKAPNPFVKRKWDYFILPETSKNIVETQERDNDKKGEKVGFIIAGVSLTLALAVFACTRGLPKNTYKYLQSAVQKLEKNVKSRKLRGEKGPITSFYNYSLEKLKNFTEKSRSINNFTSIKDLLFKKLMKKTKLTEKIHTGTTAVFENLARKTVNRSYKRTNEHFTKFFEMFSDSKFIKNPDEIVEINGISNKVSVWLEILRKKLYQTERKLIEGFGDNARLSRYKSMKAANSDIDQKVSDKCLNGVKSLRKIKDNINLLKDSPISKRFVAEDILADYKAKIKAEVDFRKSALDLEDIGEICEKLFPKNSKINKKLQKCTKLLDNAINTETELFFDKLRDMSLGSAPTDVLTVLGATGGVAIGLSKADNKDERISAALKYGIPVIGSVATSLIMTVCLVAGFKALAGGIISGYVMNRAGKIVDKYRLKKQKETEDKKNAENIKAEINAKK